MEKTKRDLALVRMVGQMREKTIKEANRDKALFYKGNQRERIDNSKQGIEHISIFEPKEVDEGFEIVGD